MISMGETERARVAAATHAPLFVRSCFVDLDHGALGEVAVQLRGGVGT